MGRSAAKEKKDEKEKPAGKAEKKPAAGGKEKTPDTGDKKKPKKEASPKDAPAKAAKPPAKKEGGPKDAGLKDDGRAPRLSKKILDGVCDKLFGALSRSRWGEAGECFAPG